jgi:1-acyl-sn-glycerol-3-phosphate acyltransferase
MLPNFLLTRAYGLENLSGAESASIYVFNHNNSLEAMMIPALLMYHLGGSSISFVIDWMYGKVPILGSLMNMIDPVYVYHKRSSLSWIEAIRPHAPFADTIERCSEKLRAGRSIGIFPEGKRNRNPETLLRGKPGVGHIALQSGAPVVPVGIDFNCRIAKGKIPVLGRTIVRVGRPIIFQQQSEVYRARMPSLSCCSRKRTELNQMAAEVTHEIMLCLAELSGKRYVEPSPRKRCCFS